jgi:hypothetical protein
MIMKAKIKLVVAILFSPIILWSQETYNTIELASPVSTSYTLNVYGKMLPGSSMKATSTTSYSIKANPQPTNPLAKNYLRTDAIQVAGVLQESQVAGLSATQRSTTFEYENGQGQVEQVIVSEGSPTLKDMVTPYQYDTYGREANTFLPYTKANDVKGNFTYAGISEQLSFYTTPPSDVASDSRPFSENTFDDTPYSQVISTFGAGSNWKTNNKAYSVYKTFNVANDVLRWSEYISGFPALSSASSGYYPANSLTAKVEVNEDGLMTTDFVNSKGLIVMSRVQDGGIITDTYRIYSPAGLLMFIVQPEGVARLSAEYLASGADKQSFLDRWTFQYQYDTEQRMIAKKIPGTASGDDGWYYIVYDQWNREVLTQSPTQRVQNKYTFKKYDRFNRTILSGVYTTSTSLATLRTEANASTVRFETEVASNPTGYTLTSSYPTSITEASLLSVTYYDNYGFLYNGWDAESNTFDYVNIAGYPQKTTDATNEIMSSVKGYKTGGKIRVLEDTRWLNQVIYYDKKYRSVQTIFENHVGGIFRSTNKPAFNDNIEKTEHYNSFSGVTITQSHTYDHANRLLTVDHSINGASPVRILSRKYNELGQVVEENTHSTDNGLTFLQSKDLGYDIRQKLIRINNSALQAESGDTNPDLFGMEIDYNVASPIDVGGVYTTEPLYAGNVSSLRWKTNNLKDTPQEKIFGFDYATRNQLKTAYYAVKNGSLWSADVGMFNEEVKGYDLNGNIKGPADPLNPGVATVALSRNAKVQGVKTTIDNLTYDYKLNNKESNRLIATSDAGNGLGFGDKSGVTEEYLYDKNGNLTYDHNKSISLIEYNDLNLTKAIQFTRAGGTIDRIEFIYDALGNKLKRIVKVNNVIVWTTDYAGKFQYDNNVLSFFQTPVGRVTLNNGAYEYEYFLKDMTNNVRVVYGSFKETKSFRATMETELATDEEDPLKEGFKNVNARRIPSDDATLNYTPVSEKVLTPDRSALVNANAGKSVGPGKSLRVLNGDIVYMEVYAKYKQVTGSANVITAAVLGAAVNGAFGIVNSGETATLYANINANAIQAASSYTPGLVQPKAYLAFLFFDDNNIYQRSGAVAISTNAFNAFEKLSRSFTADKNGWLYVYVASESNVAVANVYFDDFYVVHQKTNAVLQVTQTSDYYPFGLSFNEYQSDRLKVVSTSPSITYAPILRNRYKFQEQEAQTDLELNWYQYKWRLHDPALGRFGALDPLAEKFDYNTPYAFSENRLTDGVEYEGLEYLNTSYYGNGAPQTQQQQVVFDYLTSMGVNFANTVTIGAQTYLNLGFHLYFDGTTASKQGARDQQITEETQAGLKLIDNIQNLQSSTPPAGYVAPETYKNPEDTWAVANLYGNPDGMCYACTMARVDKAYEDLGKEPPIKLDTKSMDYALSATYLDGAATKQPYYGYGVGAALIKNGYGTPVNQTEIWNGALQLGATVQWWWDEPTFESALANKFVNIGHSIVFAGYIYFNQSIIGFYYYDSHGGLQEMYPYQGAFVGANLKD